MKTNETFRNVRELLAAVEPPTDRDFREFIYQRLLDPPDRSTGHIRYNSTHLAQLLLILGHRMRGKSLEQIRTILNRPAGPPKKKRSSNLKKPDRKSKKAPPHAQAHRQA